MEEDEFATQLRYCMYQFMLNFTAENPNHINQF